MGDLIYVAVAVLFLAVITEGLVLLGVMRQLGAVLLQVRPEIPTDVGGGPGVRSPLDLNGFSLERGAVFVFLSPNCQACESLRPAVAEVAQAHPSVPILALVAFASDEERSRYAQELGAFARPELDHLDQEWSIPGTPYVVSVDRSGYVRAKGIVTVREQLMTMAEIARRDPEFYEEGPAEAALEAGGVPVSR